MITTYLFSKWNSQSKSTIFIVFINMCNHMETMLAFIELVVFVSYIGIIQRLQRSALQMMILFQFSEVLFLCMKR